MEEGLNHTKKDKNDIQWFVMMAYKQEGKAERILSGKDGLEFYIAKHYVIQKFQGQKRKALVPCIPNIVFVHSCWNKIVEFKRKYSFIKFVTWSKSTGLEYLTVPDGQMEDFIKVSSCHESCVRYYKPEELDIKEGTRVRVIGGQFDGVEGTFLKIKGRKSRQVVVIIPEVMAVSAEVHPDLLEILD